MNWLQRSKLSQAPSIEQIVMDVALGRMDIGVGASTLQTIAPPQSFCDIINAAYSAQANLTSQKVLMELSRRTGCNNMDMQQQQQQPMIEQDNHGEMANAPAEDAFSAEFE